MTVGRRPHVGWEVRCDATGCTATTATLAPGMNRSAEAAVSAAQQLAWVETIIRGQRLHVCPLQQTWDPRLRRWVATPLSVLT